MIEFLSNNVLEILVKNAQQMDEMNKIMCEKRSTLPQQNTNESTSKNLNRIGVTTKSDRRTVTVSKVGKLVIKPKPISKSPRKSSSLTTKKYGGKPSLSSSTVTIKSKSTTISHESTFHIRNIQKKTKQNGQNVENAMEINQNPDDEPNLHFDQRQKTNQILQEITSNIVNSSDMMKDPFVKRNASEFDIDVTMDQTPTKRKSIENLSKGKLKVTANGDGNERDLKEKMPVSKEEIKRRLSALQRNSLKILENNVQRARKCSIVTTSKFDVIRKEIDSSELNFFLFLHSMPSWINGFFFFFNYNPFFDFRVVIKSQIITNQTSIE